MHRIVPTKPMSFCSRWHFNAGDCKEAKPFTVAFFCICVNWVVFLAQKLGTWHQLPNHTECASCGNFTTNSAFLPKSGEKTKGRPKMLSNFKFERWTRIVCGHSPGISNLSMVAGNQNENPANTDTLSLHNITHTSCASINTTHLS